MDWAMMLVNRIRFGGWSRGLAISVALHGAVAIALLVSVPLPERDPEPDGPVIEVTLVEPPEPPESEREPKAEPQMPEPEPEPEPAPEPQQEREPASVAGPEQADVLPPPPSPAAPEGPQQSAAVPIPVLRPVFQFGESDTGPRQALDGNAGADQTARQPAEAETMQQDSGDAGSAAFEPETSEPDSAATALPEIALPEATLPGPALAAVEPEISSSGSSRETRPAPDAGQEGLQPPAELSGAPAPGNSTADEPLQEAARLFSPVLTEDPAAMVAMGSLPRELRASQLCTTELREQLRRGAPSYRPELLPAYRLDSGNVLAVADAAFRADGAWFELSFRCTVDDQALRVAGFALSVGAAIPRTEWKARGFPDM
jgi:hypothetical protein